jgi:hypothetical protein
MIERLLLLPRANTADNRQRLEQFWREREALERELAMRHTLARNRERGIAPTIRNYWFLTDGEKWEIRREIGYDLEDLDE